MELPGHRIFRVNSIFGLQMLELALCFQQDAQRIARCDYCWSWFVPKTKRVTRYCDRVTDGFSCKQRGSRFKRKLTSEEFLRRIDMTHELNSYEAGRSEGAPEFARKV